VAHSFGFTHDDHHANNVRKTTSALRRAIQQLLPANFPIPTN
jgi:hypothetical protein